jgi:hypothetical protein
MDAPDLHERLEPLSFLVGTWRGLGVVGYPTIEEQRYEQEVVFAHDGRPFLEYSSRTWILDADGRRLRAGAREAGWWRPARERRDVEVLLSHPTGSSRSTSARWSSSRSSCRPTSSARTETAKEVNALHRLYGLVEGDLAYAVDLAAVGPAAAAAPVGATEPGGRPGRAGLAAQACRTTDASGSGRSASQERAASQRVSASAGIGRARW